MNLFLYASAIALSWAFPVDLSPAFILNLMQFSMHLSVLMSSMAWVKRCYSEKSKKSL